MQVEGANNNNLGFQNFLSEQYLGKNS